MKDQRKYLTARQQYDVDQLLTKHLRKIEDGFYEFTDGQSDAKIAAAFGVKTLQIARRREEIFGEIKATRVGDRNYFVQRMTAMEQAGKSAAKAIEDLEGRVKALEDAVTAPKKTLPMFNTPQPWKSS